MTTDSSPDNRPVYRCRLTDDWLPLPSAALTALDWREGDVIELEVIDGVVVATRVNPAVDPV